MPNIVFAEMPEAADRDIEREVSLLPASATVSRYVYRGDRDELAHRCRNADAILTDLVPFREDTLQELRQCRIISVAATGWDCVDLDAAAERGIAVSAVGEYCTAEVADHAIGMLLALHRRLFDYDRQVRRDSDWSWDRIRGIDRLDEQTLGLIGFGRIGQAVAHRAAAFGLRVLVHDPQLDESAALDLGVTPVDLTELLHRADFISLHCNLNPGRPPLLNTEVFEQMRRGVRLINVARGGLIDEFALADALDSGRVAAAALDVLSDDSPDLATHVLAGRENVLLTPHVAFLSEQSLAELKSVSASNITHFLEGRLDAINRLVPSG